MRRARPLLLGALGLLYLLHNDLWLWNDRSLVLGLPVGFVYHIGFCVAAAVLFAFLVRVRGFGGAVEEAPEQSPETGRAERRS